MRLIVNADDLGLSPEVNEGIFALMSRRQLTSATILANAPSWEAAVRE
ncbi:MAG: ChbG/HpnK family deacetylase, partial [Desulfobacca sp.]